MSCGFAITIVSGSTALVVKRSRLPSRDDSHRGPPIWVIAVPRMYCTWTRSSSTPTVRCSSSDLQAICAAYAGDLPGAKALLKEIRDKIGGEAITSRFVGNFALAEIYVALAAGHIDDAKAGLTRFADAYREAGLDYQAAEHIFKARLALLRGQADSEYTTRGAQAKVAEREILQALDLPQIHDSVENYNQACRVMGDALAVFGDRDGANKAYHRLWPSDPSEDLDWDQRLVRERLAAFDKGVIGPAFLDNSRI